MIENFNFKERYDVNDLIDIVEILRLSIVVGRRSE